VLLRRLQRAWAPDLALNVFRPIRCGRYKLVKPGELERAVKLAVRQMSPPRALLVLIDADDDCPKQLAPRLAQRAAPELSGADTPFSVVLAKREYESWFLAAFESLGGHRGLRMELRAIPNAELSRDAKKVLTRHMVGSRADSEPLDQPALTERFDLDLARKRTDSFAKCCREVERLFRAVWPGRGDPADGEPNAR